MQIHLQNLPVKFVNQGHRVRVEVAGAKKGKSNLATSFCDTHGAVSLQVQ